MGQIEDLRAFVQIVEHGSIGKAADAEGIAKSAMSRRLRLLEERMQAELISRTSRSWVLTEAGRQYYERGRDLLLSFDSFEGAVRHETQSLGGTIRLSAPLYFGKVTLTEPLTEFALRHPKVRLHVDFSDRMVDVVAENFDLVIRIAELQDSSLIARKLCAVRHVVCASPSYLTKAPAITTPSDLAAHRIIQFGLAQRPRWTFPGRAGKDIAVALNASFNSPDGGLLRDAAERGLGVTRLPEFIAQASLDAGRLVPVLPAYPMAPVGVYAVYPATRYQPQRTRALLDFLAAHLRTD